MIKGYKGFDKNLKCRDFQYEVGKEYETDSVKIYECGFHFCENPLDVFRYYPPARSRFAEVKGDGEIAKHDDDSKVACSKITIGAEIELKGIIDAGMKFIFSRVKWGEEDKPQTHGNYSAAQTHGNYSAAQTHGNSSAAQTHGDYSAAAVFGSESIAVSTGIQGKAKGALGCWLVLAEWVDAAEWQIKAVKTAKVDGTKIKADTFYQLKGGKFVEVSDE